MEIVVLIALCVLTWKVVVSSALRRTEGREALIAHVQQLLEQQPLFEGDAREAAQQYVIRARETAPNAFSEKTNVVAVAAYTLALAFQGLQARQDQNAIWVMAALHNMLGKVVANPKHYRFSSLDESLLTYAFELHTQWVQAEQQRSQTPADIQSAPTGKELLEQGEQDLIAAHSILIGEKREKIEAQGITYVPDNREAGILQMVNFPYQTYEEWEAVFKKAAIDANPNLKITDTDMSLIDLLDDEPCVRAYHHHLHPESLGKKFGESFDPISIGFEDGSTSSDLIADLKAKGRI